MENESTRNYIGILKMNSSALYRIEVQGRVEGSWSDNLSGMNITSYNQGSNEITTLVGLLRDQAALAGVLQSLYEMKLPILSVEYKG